MNKYKSKIEELEQKKEFDGQVVPVNPKHVKPLGKKFKYLPKNPLFKAYSLLIHGFLNIVGPLFTKIAYKTKIEGREKIKNIKKAIVISNHVMFTDQLLARVAVKKSKIYFAGDNFNNKKGIGGLTLKAGGFIPLGETYSEKIKFAQALEKILKKNSYVVFYPEGSLWPEYEKPRPFKRGAFFYACKFSVPVIPVFLCFKKAENKKEKFKIVSKILDPIYPDENLKNEKDKIENMRICAENSYISAYEQFYNKKLK